MRRLVICMAVMFCVSCGSSSVFPSMAISDFVITPNSAYPGQYLTAYVYVDRVSSLNDIKYFKYENSAGETGAIPFMGSQIFGFTAPGWLNIYDLTAAKTPGTMTITIWFELKNGLESNHVSTSLTVTESQGDTPPIVCSSGSPSTAGCLPVIASGAAPSATTGASGSAGTASSGSAAP